MDSAKKAKRKRGKRLISGAADALRVEPPSTLRFTKANAYALVFGMFLGLGIWKFGNPIILNSAISPPRSIREVCFEFWPPLWGVWLLFPIGLAGVWILLRGERHWPGPKWLWLLPLVWFAWQLISATETVDQRLTAITIGQFAGCLACYYLGALLLGQPRLLSWLLVGVLAAFAYCLIRAVDQHLFEFRQEQQMLVEGQSSGWTNFSSDVLLQMKHDQIIISTNGVDVANPTIVAKYSKGRVNGTLVYPNALAGLIILLFPVAITLAFRFSRQLKAPIRAMLIALTVFLGGGSLFWTGSKSGWLIATALAVLSVLFYVRWRFRAKLLLVLLLSVACLAVFAVRFQSYFASGATSLGARFDYWSAAVEVTLSKPLFGTGPGTFQRPYARLKSPDAEMARLAHNDYLEQFSDSGVVGGASYLGWVGMLLLVLWRRVRQLRHAVEFALFLGLLGWFTQGLTEFGLYVPALAWTGFTLAGCLLKQTAESVRHIGG